MKGSEEMNQRRFGKIRGKMAEYGLSQASFADKIGLTQQSVANKLSGKTAFTVRDVENICKLFDISRNEIGDYFFESIIN